jgi:hypothetical protein
MSSFLDVHPTHVSTRMLLDVHQCWWSLQRSGWPNWILVPTSHSKPVLCMKIRINVSNFPKAVSGRIYCIWRSLNYTFLEELWHLFKDVFDALKIFKGQIIIVEHFETEETWRWDLWKTTTSKTKKRMEGNVEVDLEKKKLWFSSCYAVIWYNHRFCPNTTLISVVKLHVSTLCTDHQVSYRNLLHVV